MNSMLSKEQILDATNGGLDVFEFFIKGFPGPSRARTCDHLIMSQVTNFSNNPRSNHFVKLSNINGFELIATIPAIAQAMYGIYRTINYD
ncbi:MAG: hypothetical protein DA445_04805 [Bacteroidetes bacterium]|nr:MAG: hypothetical protein DA445_04805 [Bacteroidota bacterium]